MTRARSVLPWVGFGLAALLLTGSAVAAELLQDRLPTETAGFDGWLGYLWLSSWLGFPLVGAVIASRRRTVIGWLLVLMGIGIGLAVASSGWMMYAVEVLGASPGAMLLVFVSATPALAFGLAPFAIDRFPTDEPPSGRWRDVVRGAAVVLGLVVVSLVVRPTIHDEAARAYDNPLAIPFLGTLPDVIIAGGAFLLAGFFLAVVVRAIVRLRRSSGVLRAQLKWFVSSLCVFPLFFTVVFVGGERLPQSVTDAFVAVAFFVSFNGMAAAIGIAILRYRLFEIDRLVSRTVSYLIVSAALVALYLGAVVVSQSVATPLTAGSDLAVAVSTLVAAAAFQPIRRRVQSVVDRRFNRARYDAQRTVERFSSSVRDEVDLPALVGDLEGVASATVAPRSVHVWLRAGEGTP